MADAEIWDAERLIADAANCRAVAESLSRNGGEAEHPAEVERLSAKAAALEQRARSPLPADLAQRGAGGELVAVAPTLRDTLAAPDHVAALASGKRVRLAQDAGCLALALDTADTVGPSNSLETMLAHQTAAAHEVAMMFAARTKMHLHNANHDGFGDTRRTFHAVEAGRAANSMARAMEAFQSGVTTLAKLRNGNRQVFVHQHVTVSEGGQAIVAGRDVKGSRRRRQGDGA